MIIFRKEIIFLSVPGFSIRLLYIIGLNIHGRFLMNLLEGYIAKYSRYIICIGYFLPKRILQIVGRFSRSKVSENYNSIEVTGKD